MKKPRKYYVGDDFIWVVDTDDEQFCTECDDFVMTVIEVEAFAQDEDSELTEETADYDDEIGKAFCPDCGESYTLFSDPAAAAESAFSDYQAERADAIRKGEW